jgi:flagellar hook-associated protein 3 FlgL
MIFQLAVTDLSNIAQTNDQLVQEASTGLKILKPSDDPAGAARELALEQASSDQTATITSLQAGTSDLQNAETPLTEVSNILTQAQQLAVEGANGAQTPSDFQALATQVNSLINETVSAANTQVAGRYIFGGTNTTTAPFTVTGSPATSVSYPSGNTTARTVQAASNMSISTSIPGGQAFGVGGSGDVFAALISLRDALSNGDVNSLSGSVSTAISNAQDTVANDLSAVGSGQSSLTRLVNSLQTTQQNTQSLLSSVQSVDIAQVAVQLTNTQNEMQAAVDAAGKVVMPTLFDTQA